MRLSLPGQHSAITSMPRRMRSKCPVIVKISSEKNWYMIYITTIVQYLVAMVTGFSSPITVRERNITHAHPMSTNPFLYSWLLFIWWTPTTAVTRASLSPSSSPPSPPWCRWSYRMSTFSPRWTSWSSTGS